MTMDDIKKQYYFEYDNLSLTIIKDFITDKTGDIIFIYKNPVSISANPLAEKNKMTAKELKKFLNVDKETTTRNKTPNPTKRFNLSTKLNLFLI
jgi:hypothetical protein